MDRLARVKPFVLAQPMLLAASLLPAAQIAIERFLAKGRYELRERIEEFQSWLHGQGRQASAQELQRRFVFLRLKFNSVLSQLDLFSGVITQRSENELGVWLSGTRHRGGGCAGDARILRGSSRHLLSGPKHGRCDPARANPPAGRRREPGGDHPRPARTDDWQRRRIVPVPRSGSSGGGPSRTGPRPPVGAPGQAARGA